MMALLLCNLCMVNVWGYSSDSAEMQNFIEIFQNVTEICPFEVRWVRRKFVFDFATCYETPYSTWNNSRSRADTGMRLSLLYSEVYWLPNEPIIMTVSWVETLEESCQYAISYFANCVFLNLLDKYEEKQLQENTVCKVWNGILAALL